MSMTQASVRTPLGTLIGVDQGDVHVFRGIRYAEPPVGPLRFKPPVPVGPWSGERDATRFGPISPQGASRLNLVMGDFEAEQDEDCLSLNIWKPADAAGPLPVLFWIHGGAFSSGAGSLDWYSGAAFARRHGVIVVTINYRLGALGWLRIPGISAGNMGLQDQIEALRWVRDNIEAFGGDPEAITLFGQSAGGWSIAILMAIRACRGLFARAIVQSAPLGITPASAAEAEATTGEFMALLGLDATQTGALAETPVDKLLVAARTLGMSKKSFGRVASPVAPIVDGELVDRPPMAVAAAGELADVDAIVGATREEMMAFFRFDPDFEAATEAQVADFYTRCFGDEGPAYLAEARRRRPGGSLAEIVNDTETDLKFVRPSLAFADAIRRQGRAAYVYSFDWQSPMAGLDSCHCLELPFVFGNPDAWTTSPMLAGSDPAAVAGLSDAVQSAWAAFAKTGDPSAPALPAWPPYGETARTTMCFDDVVEPVADAAGLGWRLPIPVDGTAKREAGKGS